MYSRGYTDLGISIPESYRGTAFNEEPPTNEEPITDCCTSREEQSDKLIDAEEAGASPLSRLSPTFSRLGSLFTKGGLHLPNFGTEEILLIAAAAFLIFSNDHDIECGLMLLFLLFIS